MSARYSFHSKFYFLSIHEKFLELGRWLTRLEREQNQSGTTPGSRANLTEVKRLKDEPAA